mmetsp:Transcript_13323/g.42449  ORF Transcript_13323/g.42449 Transcript_13323/m.42449 type:complete len:504 (+) Transcript_13323:137-1648(+)
MTTAAASARLASAAATASFARCSWSSCSCSACWWASKRLPRDLPPSGPRPLLRPLPLLRAQRPCRRPARPHPVPALWQGQVKRASPQDHASRQSSSRPREPRRKPCVPCSRNTTPRPSFSLEAGRRTPPEATSPGEPSAWSTSLPVPCLTQRGKSSLSARLEALWLLATTIATTTATKSSSRACGARFGRLPASSSRCKTQAKAAVVATRTKTRFSASRKTLPHGRISCTTAGRTLRTARKASSSMNSSCAGLRCCPIARQCTSSTRGGPRPTAIPAPKAARSRRNTLTGPSTLCASRPPFSREESTAARSGARSVTATIRLHGTARTSPTRSAASLSASSSATGTLDRSAFKSSPTPSHMCTPASSCRRSIASRRRLAPAARSWTNGPASMRPCSRARFQLLSFATHSTARWRPHQDVSTWRSRPMAGMAQASPTPMTISTRTVASRRSGQSGETPGAAATKYPNLSASSTVPSPTSATTSTTALGSRAALLKTAGLFSNSL